MSDHTGDLCIFTLLLWGEFATYVMVSKMHFTRSCLYAISKSWVDYEKSSTIAAPIGSTNAPSQE